MPDPRFFVTVSPIDVVHAASLCDAEHVEASRRDVSIRRVCGFQHEDRQGAAMFIKGASYFPEIQKNPPAACLLPANVIDDALEAGLGEVTALLSCNTNARLSFALLAGALHTSMMDMATLPQDLPPADIAASAHVAESAIVSPGAVIGEGTIIGPMSFVGPGVVIGKNCRIATSVTISHTVMGDECRIASGARIGEPGFGFVADGRKQIAVPQLGLVVIGDDVEIGANTTVDRGALSDTRIGTNSKIDNLVQIAHNVIIGESCVLAGMCGISGSCVIGDGAMLGGQAVLGDHVTVGKDARIYARSALMHNVPDGQVWAGMPAKPARQYFKEIAVLAKLAKNSSGKQASE